MAALPGEICEAVADGGFEDGGVCTVVWENGAEASVNFPGAGGADEFGDIAGMDSTAGQNCEEGIRLMYQFLQ